MPDLVTLIKTASWVITAEYPPTAWESSRQLLMSFLLSAYGIRSHCPVPFLSRPLYSCLTSSSYKHSFASCTLKPKPLYWSHIPLLSLFSSQKGSLNLLFYFFTSTAQFTVKKKKKHLSPYTWDLVKVTMTPTCQIQWTCILILFDPLVALNALGLSFLVRILSGHGPTTPALQMYLLLPFLFRNGFALFWFAFLLTPPSDVALQSSVLGPVLKLQNFLGKWISPYYFFSYDSHI